MTPGQFLDSLIPSIQEAGGSVSSWIRSTNRNVQVGGHPDSFHIVGLAVDVYGFFNDESRRRFCMRARRMGYGVKDYNEDPQSGKTHVHVQAFPKGS